MMTSSNIDNLIGFESLKSLAKRLASDRSSVRRWLKAAGIRAYVFGNGPKAAIRYRREDIDIWLRTRETIA